MELRDGVILFPFFKDGPVYSMLKEVQKEALKQLLSWLLLRNMYVTSLRNLPKQKRVFNCNPRPLCGLLLSPCPFTATGGQKGYLSGNDYMKE